MAAKHNPDALYRKIAAQLRDHIEAGLFLPGEMLPPLEKLATNYGVKPGTMRDAREVVADEGLIFVRNGDGTYVKPEYHDKDTPEERLHKALRIAVYTTGASLPAIVTHMGCKRWVMYEQLGRGENLTPERCLEIIDAAEAVTGKKAPESCREQMRRQLSQP